MEPNREGQAEAEGQWFSTIMERRALYSFPESPKGKGVPYTVQVSAGILD